MGGAGREHESEDGGDDERDEYGQEEGEPGRDFGVGDVGEGDGWVGGGEGAVVGECAPEAGADGGDASILGFFVSIVSHAGNWGATKGGEKRKGEGRK